MATSRGASPSQPRPLLRIIGMANAIPSSAMMSVRKSQSRIFSSRMRREECFSASFRKRSVGKGSCSFRLFCMRCSMSGTPAPNAAAMRKKGERNMGRCCYLESAAAPRDRRGRRFPAADRCGRGGNRYSCRRRLSDIAPETRRRPCDIRRAMPRGFTVRRSPVSRSRSSAAFLKERSISAGIEDLEDDDVVALLAQMRERHVHRGFVSEQIGDHHDQRAPPDRAGDLVQRLRDAGAGGGRQRLHVLQQVVQMLKRVPGIEADIDFVGVEKEPDGVARLHDDVTERGGEVAGEVELRRARRPTCSPSRRCDRARRKHAGWFRPRSA